MLTFEKLWSVHPTVAGEDKPCSTKGVVHYENQCAVRVGACLARAGVTSKDLQGLLHYCGYHPNSEGHVLRAEELAGAIERLKVVPAVETVAPKDFAQTLSGRRGIIFFKDYWQRAGETEKNRSGDHIDLWNGSRLTDWTTWARIHMTFGEYGFAQFGRRLRFSRFAFDSLLASEVAQYASELFRPVRGHFRLDFGRCLDDSGQQVVYDKCRVK